MLSTFSAFLAAYANGSSVLAISGKLTFLHLSSSRWFKMGFFHLVDCPDWVDKGSEINWSTLRIRNVTWFHCLTERNYKQRRIARIYLRFVEILRHSSVCCLINGRHSKCLPMRVESKHFLAIKFQQFDLHNNEKYLEFHFRMLVAAVRRFVGT